MKGKSIIRSPEDNPPKWFPLKAKEILKCFNPIQAGGVAFEAPTNFEGL